MRRLSVDEIDRIREQRKAFNKTEAERKAKESKAEAEKGKRKAKG